MSDPWALSVAILALLGQAPSFIGNWESLLNKIKNRKSLSESEVTESEITLLESRLDWLTYKIMLLDLLVAFSKEHTMNPQVIEFCQKQRPNVYDEFKKVREKLLNLVDSNEVTSKTS